MSPLPLLLLSFALPATAGEAASSALGTAVDHQNQACLAALTADFEADCPNPVAAGRCSRLQALIADRAPEHRVRGVTLSPMVRDLQLRTNEAPARAAEELARFEACRVESQELTIGEQRFVVQVRRLCIGGHADDGSCAETSYAVLPPMDRAERARFDAAIRAAGRGRGGSGGIRAQLEGLEGVAQFGRGGWNIGYVEMPVQGDDTLGISFTARTFVPSTPPPPGRRPQ